MKLHHNKIRYLLLAVPLMLAGLLSNSFNFGAHAIEPQTGTSGTCTWNIDTDGNMVIRPTSGEECMLANSTAASSMSYHPYRSSIITIKFEGKVYANTQARYLFRDMTNLTDIDFAGFDTLNVTNMRYMFSNVSSVASLDLSSFDTSNVTNMGSMFEGTDSLVSLNISSFDTTNTIYMDDFLNKGQSDVLREISLGLASRRNWRTISWYGNQKRSRHLYKSK